MKKNLLTALIQLLPVVVFAQGVSSPVQGDNKAVKSEVRTIKLKRHCTATRVGEIMMMTGGGVGIYGLVAMSLPLSGNSANGDNYKFSESMGIAGFTVAIYGAITFLTGKNFERSNHARFTLGPVGKGVGLAYRF